MNTYFQFGDLKLPVAGGLHDFGGQKGYDYAEYSLASGKNIIKPVGEKLRRISLAIMLRTYVGDDIPATIATVDKMMASGEAYDLIFIDGYYKGKYCISDISDKLVKTLPSGGIIAYDFTLELTESAERTTSGENVQKVQTKNENLKSKNAIAETIYPLTVVKANTNAEMLAPTLTLTQSKKSIGDRLGNALTTVNAKTTDAAKALNVAESTMKKYLSGVYALPVGKAVLLAQKFGINVDFLYRGVGTATNTVLNANNTLQSYQNAYLSKFKL